MAGDNISKLLLQRSNAFQFMMQRGAAPLSAYWFQGKAATAAVPALADYREPPSPELESWDLGHDPKLKGQKNTHIGELLEELAQLIIDTPEGVEVDIWFDKVFMQANDCVDRATKKLTVDRGDKKQGKGDLTLQILDSLIKWVKKGDAESASHEPLLINQRFKIAISYQYYKGDQYAASIPLQDNFKSLVTLLMEAVILLQANNFRFNILGGKRYLDTPAVEFIIYLLKKIDYINEQNAAKVTLKQRYEDYETITGSLIQFCDECIRKSEVGALGTVYNGLLDVTSSIAKVGSYVAPDVVAKPMAAISGTIGSQMPNRQGDTEFIEAFRDKLRELLSIAHIANMQAQSPSAVAMHKSTNRSAFIQPVDTAEKAMVTEFETHKGGTKKSATSSDGQDVIDLLSGAKSTSRKKGASTTLTGL